MEYQSDLEIARGVSPLPIEEIARGLGLAAEDWEPYGRYKAKLTHGLCARTADRPAGRLVLVTAISPTPAGEGKTTTSIGLADALRRLGHKAVLALREPSLGPVFGVKGGAAGGGYAQLTPMEDINLHFTGDIHAVTAANNLLSALIDNHLQQGNALGLDPRRITWRRCLDMNDRALRHAVVGLGGAAGGVPREERFEIAAASEVMAVLSLAAGRGDLKERLRRLVVGQTGDGTYVTAGDLRGEGAMAALLDNALQPNLVQTLEHTPALVHGGPFANIAHGCNSVTATRTALGLGDIAVTEAGFGADLGAEKFIDIKCRQGGFKPSACVLVVTLRALKYHGGAEKGQYERADGEALSRGFPNLLAHAETLRDRFGLPVVVALNRFPGDGEDEVNRLLTACRSRGLRAAVSEVWARGGAGGEELARLTLEALEEPSTLRFAYEEELPLAEKAERIVTDIYGGAGVQFDPPARKTLAALQREGWGRLPVCMAKTQYSLSDDPKKRGRPTGFTVRVTDVKLSAGAGFVVVYTGEVMTMPGLPRVPAAESIDVDENGLVRGLY
ncbi:MAG: formate--tetrahydrofolate ligase [Oscillospiraceae bacterium]|jgi:formate--tetrahydrofolate ligase|nr:formate--tetrahydrofolate ligase [Oscillospiraceae bacterium]